MAKKKKTIEEKFVGLGVDIKSENESAKNFIEDRISKSILPEDVWNINPRNNIFDAVKQWHEIAGINVSTENTLEELKSQIESIVQSEIDETFDAWNSFSYHTFRKDKGYSSQEIINKCKAELLDGLGDTIWTCVGMILRLGINPNDVMQRILDSNNSKFVPVGITDKKHIDIIEQTVEKYKKQGIEVEHHVDNGYLVFRNKETKKILKPITFVEPKLEQLL